MANAFLSQEQELSAFTSEPELIPIEFRVPARYDADWMHTQIPGKQNKIKVVLDNTEFHYGSPESSAFY